MIVYPINPPASCKPLASFSFLATCAGHARLGVLIHISPKSSLTFLEHRWPRSRRDQQNGLIKNTEEEHNNTFFLIRFQRNRPHSFSPSLSTIYQPAILSRGCALLKLSRVLHTALVTIALTCCLLLLGSKQDLSAASTFSKPLGMGRSMGPLIGNASTVIRRPSCKPLTKFFHRRSQPLLAAQVAQQLPGLCPTGSNGGMNPYRSASSSNPPTEQRLQRRHCQISLVTLRGHSACCKHTGARISSSSGFIPPLSLLIN